MTDRTEYIAGLRQLAGWLEEHPDVPFPRYSTDIAVPLRDNPAVAEFAAVAGVEVETDEKGNTSADIKFGPVTYHAYGYADWDKHRAEHSENQARTWADSNGMVIQPREAGDES